MKRGKIRALKNLVPEEYLGRIVVSRKMRRRPSEGREEV